MNLDRRQVLKLAALLAAAATVSRGYAMDAAPRADAAGAAGEGGDFNVHALGGASNFKAIYGNPALKAAFLDFLTNVFHLFPEERLHRLIEDAANAGDTDREVYALVQSRLPEIKPFLAELRFALPALSRQKDEMAAETLQLLGAGRPIDGYLEVGSTGRYVSRLKSDLELKGDLVLLHSVAPGYSPEDIVERAGLFKLGRFVAMNDYAPVPASQVPDRSLDVVANYIGFHHSPLSKLDAFVASLHRMLRPGARMIVRDHDVATPELNRMVALAHDVFNMGLGTPWPVNQGELRHFTSIAQLVTYLEARGFKDDGRRLYQKGDPTRNALMLFSRV
jgi:SAM-dependent methyltransferase